MRGDFEIWEGSLRAMAERVAPMGGYLAGSAVLGLLRGEVMGVDVDVYVGPAGGVLLRRWHPAAPPRGRFVAEGIEWHLVRAWPTPNDPGLDVLALGWNVSGVMLRPTDLDLDLATVLENVAMRRFAFTREPDALAVARAVKLEQRGWHCMGRRDLGDLTEAVLAPFVARLDAALGTNLTGCSGCARRRALLNRLSRLVKAESYQTSAKRS